MSTAATTTAKHESWWPLVWGLAAFLVGPYLPYLEAIAPIQESLLLLVPAIGLLLHERVSEVILSGQKQRPHAAAASPSLCRA